MVQTTSEETVTDAQDSIRKDKGEQGGPWWGGGGSRPVILLVLVQ